MEWGFLKTPWQKLFRDSWGVNPPSGERLRQGQREVKRIKREHPDF